MNISSIVVQTLPKYLDSVIENLKKTSELSRKQNQNTENKVLTEVK